LFGKKSARVDARQLQLALEQLANEPGAVTEPIEMYSGDTPVRGHTRRRPTGRRPLPGHLPRRRIEIDVPEADKQCASGARTRSPRSTSAAHAAGRARSTLRLEHPRERPAVAR
jgi:hypothetical protein